MVQCNGKCISRYILVGVNTLIAALGILVLALGALFLNGDNVIGGYIAPIFSAVPGAYGSSVGSLFTYLAISAVFIGCLLLIIGILGCCGGIWAKKVLLYVYSGMVIFVILLEIVGVILSITLKDEVDDELRKSLKNTITDSYTGSSASDYLSQGWNYVFITYKCCGVDTYLDLHEATKWNRPSGELIPDSCCKVEGGYPHYVVLDTACTTSPNQTNANISEGCFTSIRDLIHQYNNYLIGVGCSVLVLEIVLIVFACIASRKRQKVDISKDQEGK